ncbi:MAG: tRNA (adenosine(37)-N6)-threonylcarbamoyltransferase complex transferase subunit TsaD [Patescibacteria group bacterium]
MKILAIETSCDETAISVVSGKGGLKKPVFKVLAHFVSSQTAIHAPYGGVVPNLAKREHQRNLVPLLLEALNSKGKRQKAKLKVKIQKKLETILAREPELLEQFLKTIPTLKIPKIDAIAVTQGPGLEPALWVGINFAKALGVMWNLPIIPINHLEGHVVSSLVKLKGKNQKAKLKVKSENLKFPALALLISGGHTEIVLMKDWGKYKVIGQTRDDAVGEAFDKVARILGLPYPGGPALSKLASRWQGLSLTHPKESPCQLPRPMLNSPDFDFSFSGLKTAVLYLTQKLSSQEPLPESLKAAIAHEFQEAAIEVLATKTFRAVEKFKPRTLLIGGGVIANTALRKHFETKVKDYPEVTLLIPDQPLTTDNATMIGAAAYLRHAGAPKAKAGRASFSAQGNLILK